MQQVLVSLDKNRKVGSNILVPLAVGAVFVLAFKKLGIASHIKTFVRESDAVILVCQLRLISLLA